jgi:hypothetical protein
VRGKTEASQGEGRGGGPVEKGEAWMRKGACAERKRLGRDDETRIHCSNVLSDLGAEKRRNCRGAMLRLRGKQAFKEAYTDEIGKNITVI